MCQFDAAVVLPPKTPSSRNTFWFQSRERREKYIENKWVLVGFGQVVLDLCSCSSGMGMQSKCGKWLVSSAQGRLRASDELCSFTARLMETSRDFNYSLSLSLPFSPRGKHTFQHPNGYLWDLIPGTSAGLQVHTHHYLFFLHLSLNCIFLFYHLESSKKFGCIGTGTSSSTWCSTALMYF